MQFRMLSAFPVHGLPIQTDREIFASGSCIRLPLARWSPEIRGSVWGWTYGADNLTPGLIGHGGSE